MKKSYCFDYEKYFEALDEIYPMTMSGFNYYLDYSTLTYENFERVKKVLEEVINDPKLKDYHEDDSRKNEEITCLPESVKKAFDELFSNPDIYVYGHGGNAKEIIESEGFKCRYANLESHFLPLDHTDKSLGKLDNWPHKDCTRIAILALNNSEYNPIYKEIEKENSYDTDIYTIPNEYFAGYYDREEKIFVPNPNFKLNHEYNPENTRYQDEDRFSYQIPDTDDELIREYFRNIEKIKNVLFFSSHVNLSKDGYIDVKKQVINLINKAKEIQNKLTPEYIENLINSENDNSITHNNFDSDEWGSDDWEFDEDKDSEWIDFEENQKTR